MQSIGGGGGAGGSVHTTSTTLKCQIQLWRICCFGGSGGGGGNAGLVSLGSSSQIADLDIATVGDTAHGVFLQSIGGGGGAGSSVTSGAAGGDLSANFSFGATGSGRRFSRRRSILC